LSIDWAQVYRATYPDLVRFLYRKVWDADRSQDLAQEVFLRCLREGAHAQIGNVRAFVFTVANNLAKDEARTVLRRRKHLVLLKNETDSATDAAEVAASIDRERKVAAVQAALSDLGERDREILLLWDAGLSYQEISQQTGLAIGAIGTTLSRARKRLVATYEEIERQKHVARG